MRKMVAALLTFALMGNSLVYGGTPTSPDNRLQASFVILSNDASIKGNGKEGTLVLKGVSPHIIYLADRPNRVSGQMETTKFVDLWKTGGFSKSAPNAVIEAVVLNRHGKGEKDLLPNAYSIVLTKPIYKAGKDKLEFHFKTLPGNQMPIPAQVKADYVAVFVDGVCLTCVNG